MNFLFRLIAILSFFFLITLDAQADIYSDDLYCTKQNNQIDKFACMTEHTVQGIKATLASQGIILSKDELAFFSAVEAMQLVQNIASTGRYAYVRTNFPEFRAPTMDEQSDLLKKGIGICGNHQHLFINVLQRIGVIVRPVDLFYSDEICRHSHAAAEVMIGYRWMYFDVTWGSYWLNNPTDNLSGLSVEDVLKGLGTRISNNNSYYLTRTHAKLLERYRPFTYLTANNLQILKSRGGLLNVEFRENEIDFSHIPKYIGKNLGNEPLRWKLGTNFDSGHAELDIRSVGGICQNSSIKIGENSYPIAVGKIKIEIAPNSIIEIKGEDEICYSVVSSLKLIKE